MAKLTLSDLKKLRDEGKKTMSPRETTDKDSQIIIGMGTCGIAAGAKVAFDACLDEIQKQGLTNVTITQTGCMGLCYSEPTVEVQTAGIPPIIYGNVTPDVARSIITEHIMKKQLINDHIFDKPATDLVR
jgi:NADP-reducing hydrogenase subunit HndB